MRVALLHPTYWPEVTRGAERIVHDLAVTLAESGHEVTIVTGHPAPRSESVEEGVRVVRCRRLPQPPLFGLNERFLGQAPNVLRAALGGEHDVIHAFHLTDAWAATLARRRGGPPVVFTYVGIPTRHHLVDRRLRLEMMEAVARNATCTVLSEAAAEPFRRYLRAEPRVIPAGLLDRAFEPGANGAPSADLLFPASIGDPRKRGELLLRAFESLRGRRPDLRLLVARARDPFLSPLDLRLPEGADWFDPEGGVEMTGAYASAATMVLPSVEEPFGLVLLESMAAGVPVVAARSGACPELVADSRVGRLFEPDDQTDLERAIEESLALASDPETGAACREHARRYEWPRIAGAYEAVYREAVGER